MIYFKPNPRITDELYIGSNDGSIHAIAISDTSGISYSLTGANIVSVTSITGTYTGLQPGNYVLTATNLAGESTTLNFGIVKATEFTTHNKYKLEFENEDGTVNYLVKISNMQKQYSSFQYPVLLQTSSEPVIHSIKLQEEDKSSPFAPSSLTINLITDGNFTVDEFATADERTFFVEYFEGDNLIFKGWLLPDQVDDVYDDLGYDVSLVATEGLLSLKGIEFGDGTGVRLFRIQPWLALVRYCLDKLDYFIGNITIVKSLQYDGQMDYNNVGLWADLFYDEDGVAITVYDALELLLTQFKVVLFQNEGKFFIVDYNVLSHLILAPNQSLYDLSFYEYDVNNQLLYSGQNVTQPNRLKIGVNEELIPVQKIPPLSYDNSFKQLEAKLDFNLLSLLYNNPSFEVGAVEGQLPLGFKQATDGGLTTAGVTKSDAYLGDWSLKIYGNGSNYGKIEFSETVPIDQIHKSLQLSFNWKPTKYNNGLSADLEQGLVFAVLPYFLRDDGKAYYLRQAPYRALSDDQIESPNRYDQPSDAQWIEIKSPQEQFLSEGNLTSIKGAPTNDYSGWQSFSINSPEIPGTGQLTFHIYSTKAVFFDESFQPGNLQGESYTNISYDTRYYVLYDNLVLTLNDTAESYNKQIGEKHVVTNMTNYAKSEKKTVDIPVTNYTTNKRLAANVFYGLDYATANTRSLWKDHFVNTETTDSSTPANTRTYITGYLPQVTINQLARSYQRPMYKLEPTVQSGALSFFSIFEVAGYEGKPFIPFSITHSPAKSEAELVICETDDTEFDSQYQYIAKFEKNAKKIVN